MRRSLLKTLAALSVAAGAVAISTPASAAVACAGSMDNFSPVAAIDCNGFYDGNVLSGNSADVAIQEAAVEDLLGTNIDPFLFNNYPKQDGLNGALTINFGAALTGNVVIGLHFGNGNGQFPENAVGNATGFFLFNFVNPTSSIQLTIPALSATVIYGGTNPPPPRVPEPATWAMMLLGFGATGFALRRRRRETTALTQIA